MSLLKVKNKQIKPFLLTQKKISGLSDMFMHDILFKANLHPLKNISDMSDADIKSLYHSIVEYIKNCRNIMDFFGENGAFERENFVIAYKDNGEPCPACSEPIALIKTGSTSSYVCPACQKL